MLRIVPCKFDEACEFIAHHHRHHKPPVGHKYSLAVADDVVRGVAVVGRPVSRHMDDGMTLEVTRLCTDGTKNACSKLYSAAWRVARELGFTRLITYTLPEEGGSSLRAAGWQLVGTNRGGSWSVPSRPRVDKHPTQRKLKWMVEA